MKIHVAVDRRRFTEKQPGGRGKGGKALVGHCRQSLGGLDEENPSSAATVEEGGIQIERPRSGHDLQVWLEKKRENKEKGNIGHRKNFTDVAGLRCIVFMEKTEFKFPMLYPFYLTYYKI